MSTMSSYRFICTDSYCISSSLSYRSTISRISTSCPSLLNKFLWCPHPLSPSRTRRAVVLAKYSEGSEVSTTKDEWLKKLPDKNKPFYAHSLPCIEAWLKSLGFYQSKDDRALWFVEKPDWHAQLSLDVTDLYIRVRKKQEREEEENPKVHFSFTNAYDKYLKSGPGNLEKDMERRFSYALSREDIENAVLGGP